MNKPIRISGSQASDLGQFALKVARDAIREGAEKRTGFPHEWVQLYNMDAIELRPVGQADSEREDPKAFARLDVFDGHIICQYEPGRLDKLIRELLNVVDFLRTRPMRSFIQTVEVSEVKT